MHEYEEDEDGLAEESEHEPEQETEEALPSALRGSLETTFGADLGDVRVHTGPGAKEQAEAEDAHAFTRGNDIYFNQGEYQPGTAEGDRLIAHEAAHVVQNKAGATADTQRKARAPEGTSAEHEADAAADAAVARIYGGSDKVASIGAAPTGAVMHKKKKKKATKKAPAIDEKTLLAVSADLFDILSSKNSRPRTGKFSDGLAYLEYAAIESAIKATADQRLTFLRAAMAILDPVFTAMGADQRWVSWMQSAKIKPRIAELRTDLNERKAADRVESTSLGSVPSPELDGAGAAGSGADADAKKTRAAIALHLKASGKVTDLANKIANPGLGDDAGPAPPMDLKGKGALGLDAINDALSFASGLLELTDEEFEKKKASITAVPSFKNASTRAELIKASLELLNSGVGMTSKTARLVALQLGKTDLAAQLDKVAGFQGLGHAISAITVVHSACVLLDTQATDQEKLDAGVAGTGALLQLGGAAANAAGLATASAVLGGAATVLGTTYMLLKFATDLYWTSQASIMAGYTQRVFTTLADDSSSLVRQSEKLVVTGMLLAAEQDPDQITALAALERRQAAKLGATIDWFLERASKYDAVGGAGRVGSYRTLREAFASHQALAGRTDPAGVIEAATAIIQTINWVFENARYVQTAEIMRGGLAKVNELKEEDRIKKEDEERRKAEEAAFYNSLDVEEDPEGWTVDDGYGL